MNKEFGAMVVWDAQKCTRCHGCELACFAAHGRLGKTVGTVISPVQPRLFVEAEGAVVTCRHCENAPCMAACPRGAIARENGQVVLHGEKCAGCTAMDCMAACPFGCIRALPGPKKCDLCGGEPACVRACPNGALRLAELTEERETKNANALRWLSCFF